MQHVVSELSRLAGPPSPWEPALHIWTASELQYTLLAIRPLLRSCSTNRQQQQEQEEEQGEWEEGGTRHGVAGKAGSVESVTGEAGGCLLFSVCGLLEALLKHQVGPRSLVVGSWCEGSQCL